MAEIEEPQIALTECPDCGGDKLQEFGYRFTWQGVTRLRVDGAADDYGEWEVGDETDVIGWGCGECDWSLCGDTKALHDALYALYEQALERLQALPAKAAGVELSA